ncbi:MAG: D-glycero-beta-D-manno-heptose-7-phosphate kinase [Neisseriaceae bacterium]
MNLDNITIAKLKSNLDDKKILVVGDVMLDQYWFGEVERISPEAPVPVASIKKVELRPGGAANVARNIASLGGNVTLLSVVGDDEHATNLEKILESEKINFLLHRDNTTDTIVKLRVIARNQQLIRLDFERKPSHEILLDIFDKFKSMVDEYEVVILSDYGKGGLSHTEKMIEYAKSHNKLVLVDPKGNDYTKYHNATIITPNKNELRSATREWENEEQLIQQAMQLKNQLNLEYLLVTRSDEGMTLFTPDSHITYPTVAQEVFDVSGAGDTVIATLGLMLANGIDIQQTTQIANIAAGIVVGKLGTASVTKEELLSTIGIL